MSSASYLSKIGAAVAAMLLGVTLFISAIDPYGVTGGLWQSERPRAGRVDRDRIIKPIDIWKLKPKTLIFGSSRIKNAIDPERLGPGAYNSGIDGVTVQGQREMFEFALLRNSAMKVAIFEVGYFQFFRVFDKPSIKVVEPQQWYSLVPKLFMSGDSLKLSLLTAFQSDEAFPTALRPNGWVWSPPPAHTGGEAFMVGFGKSWATLTRAWYKIRDERSFAELNKIIELCGKHSIDCRFVITPVSGPMMACIQLDGELPHYLLWRDRLLALGRVMDFSDGRYFEDLDRSRGFWSDSGHFTPIVGADIAETVMSQKVTSALIDVSTAVESWKRANNFTLAACNDSNVP